MGPNSSTCLNDDSFGPAVSGCRGDFDFTLTFEEIILSIVPSVCFILLAGLRIIQLSRKPTVLSGHWFQAIKLVRPLTTSRASPANQGIGNHPCVCSAASCSGGFDCQCFC